jgi:hypothetical protein
VLKGDASLALFPLLSTIFASLAMVSIWAPTLITRGVFDHQTVERKTPGGFDGPRLQAAFQPHPA